MVNEDAHSDDVLKNARVSKWYDDIANSVTKCVFCDLRAKYVVLETKSSVLTMSLYPYIDGQLLILPKRHVEDLAQLTQTEWKDTKALTELGTKLIKEEFGIGGVQLLYRGGENSGKSVGHLHFHLLPITKEFMTYDKNKGFIYKFQKIQYSPVEVAERYRRLCKKKT